MGDGNSEGLSTKSGKIVDGGRKFRGAIHEIGRNRGREAEIREAIHENGGNRGWETGMRGRPSTKSGERAVGLKCVS